MIFHSMPICRRFIQPINWIYTYKVDFMIFAEICYTSDFVYQRKKSVPSLFQNLFGVIRGHNGYNDHPSAAIFRGTLRLTAACQLIKVTSQGNCTNIDERNLISIMDSLGELSVSLTNIFILNKHTILRTCNFENFERTLLCRSAFTIYWTLPYYMYK